MNQDLLLIISFISMIFYCGNIMADASFDRPLSSHFGYGLISIITTWQTIPVLAIVLLIIFIIYSLITFSIYIESQRSKNHAQDYSRRKIVR